MIRKDSAFSLGNGRLQIYLDSNDYSVLSNPRSIDDASIQEAKNKLKAWIASDEIVVRQSMISVIEAAPITPNDIKLAGLRFSCIKELCRKFSLVNPFELFKLELLALSSGSEPTSMLLDNGRWIPELNGIEIPDPKSSINEEINKLDLNRQQRRRLAKLTESSYKDRVRDDEIIKITKEIPANKASILALRKYMSGRCSKASVIEAFKDSFSDLELWGRIYEDYWDSASSASAWLRIQGKKLNELLCSFSSSVKGIYETAALNGLPESEVKKIAKSANRKNRDKFFSDCTRKMAEGLDVKIPEGTIPTWESSPGIYTLITLYYEKLKTKSIDLKSGASGKISDFGDFMHAIYLPYVDIFRCDRATADLIRRAVPEKNTYIAASLPDLLSEIDRRINNGQS